MWRRGKTYYNGCRIFFRIVVIDDSLESFYTLNFELAFEKRFSIEELENMLPWEREVYYQLTVAKLQELANEAN